ncbi:MAG TPA: C4-type zinc ribbon domain-containing protein [Bacteroidota bacterium]|nr:C4-type zinc ribbon domain-containing protein [Bacteroidota bacterium]
MEERLRLLYTLQMIDANLNELEESKGDLPRIVRQLREDVAALEESIKQKRDLITQNVEARNQSDEDLAEFKEKLERYKSQQYQVRNNKEYDAITKEIEFAQESIASLEGRFQNYEAVMSAAKLDIDALTLKLNEKTEELAEKEVDLAKVSEATDEEEMRFRTAREKVTSQISREDLNQYERIRSARGIVSVAVIWKNRCCSGCKNQIPPQHLIEIRKNDELYMCQHCGRMIVSDQLASTVDVPA